MAESILSDSPEWFDAEIPDEHREAAIELDFERVMADSKEFKNASPAEQKDMQLAHRQLIEEAALNSAHNPLNQQAVLDQQETDYGSFGSNLMNTMGRSLKGTASRVTIVDDLVGQIDADYPSQLATYLNKQAAAPITAERKQLAHTMKVWGEEKAASGFWGDVKATAKMVGDIAVHPGGVLDVAAESIGSMASMGAGAEAGSLAAAGLTAATGGWAAPAAPFITGAGMFAAETADAASSKMTEKIQLELDKQELAYTPSNIQMLLDQQPELIQQIQTKSLQYGGILGAVDVALGGFFSKMASLPTKAARKAAMRSIDDVGRAALSAKAAELGVPVTQLTEDFISHGAKQILAARSLKNKLGYKALSYGGEVASEPISEAIATAGSGEENTAENLIYETLGGIGAGPIGASINTAAFGTKLAGNKTGEAVKKILTSTPETRKDLAEINNETSKVKVLADARNQAGYKKEVETVTAEDTRLEEWGNTAHENYNPVKAIHALSRFAEDPAMADKAEAIYAPLKERAIALHEQIATLIGDKDPQTLPTQTKEKIKALSEQLAVQESLLKQTSPVILAIRGKNTKISDERTVTPLNVDTASSQEVIDHTVEAFGSSKSSLGILQLDQRLQRDDLPDTERSLLQSLKEAAEARQVLETTQQNRRDTSGKTLAAVQEDVYRGTGDFKGIDAYKTAIAHYLNPAINNQDGATQQIEGLKKFRDAHQKKLQKLEAAFAEVSKISYDPKTENRPSIKVWAGGQAYNIHANSGRLIEAVRNETTALNKEVAAAENLFNAKAAPAATITTNPAATVLDPKLVTSAKEYAATAAKQLASGQTTQEIVQTKEQAILKKHGPEVAKVFRSELTRLTAEAVQTSEQTGTQEAPSQSSAPVETSAVVSQPTETKPVVSQNETKAEHNPVVSQESGNAAPDEQERLAAENDAQDIESNAKTAEKLVIDGHVKNVKISDNSAAHGWYLTAGYKASEVVKALRNYAGNKKLTEKQTQIVEKWQEDLNQRLNKEGTPSANDAPQKGVQQEDVSANKKGSTTQENTDSVSANAVPEQVDPGTIPITYTALNGEAITQTYNEAMLSIMREREETQQILNCLRQ